MDRFDWDGNGTLDKCQGAHSTRQGESGAHHRELGEARWVQRWVLVPARVPVGEAGVAPGFHNGDGDGEVSPMLHKEVSLQCFV